MTLREALCFAIETLRTMDPDDAMAKDAARQLEKKAERLRARTEAPAVWEHRCYCGERRERRALLCVECHRAVPMAVLVTVLTGKPKARKRAQNQIAEICALRIGSDAGQAEREAVAA